MRTLRSYVAGRWHEADSDFAPLYNPSTEEEIARASSRGIDFGAALDWARERGGPALRALTFGQRAALLKDMSKAIRDRRDELLDLSALATGTTRPDGAFDIDGASGTLAYYAALGKGVGDRRLIAEGEGVQLAKTEAAWGRHVLVPRPGVAVLINAFNFPAWGFAEKAACALLAGMPVLTKPATSTAWVAERVAEIVIDAGILPEGALQIVCGSTGDLLDRLGPQDVLAFTGSMATALSLRDRHNLAAASTRLNVEADSLNAAVLGPDVDTAGPTFDLFRRDVEREMTQKSGQKCTAVRRILAPRGALDAARDALAAALGAVVTGNPADPAVTMGPLATAQQLRDAEDGVAELAASSRILAGGGRVDGAGAPRGKGYFLAPTLLEAPDANLAGAVHRREVFGPVATLLPYDGTAAEAAAIVALGGGMLVTSAYSDDSAWLAEFLAHGGAASGRFYIGSREAAAEAPGSGVALPHLLHGGPGRAGGGAELGGLRGLELYLQRVALQGNRPLVESLAGG